MVFYLLSWAVIFILQLRLSLVNLKPQTGSACFEKYNDYIYRLQHFLMTLEIIKVSFVGKTTLTRRKYLSNSLDIYKINKIEYFPWKYFQRVNAA